MSFSWTSVTQFSTPIAIIHFNEIRTNTNTLCTNLGISAYSWTVLPVAQYSNITYAQINQLRAALDYVHTNNTCVTNNSSADATANASQDSAANGSQDSPVNTAADSAANPSQNNPVYSSQDAPQDSGANSGVNGHNVNNNWTMLSYSS
jgi:hypothetical protein